MYKGVSAGDPLVSETIYGPVHGQAAMDVYTKAIANLRSHGAELLTGGNKIDLGGDFKGGFFVEPTSKPHIPHFDFHLQ